MQKNKLNILSTRPLRNDIIEQAANQNVIIDCLSFIETERIKTPGLKEKILHLFSKKNHRCFYQHECRGSSK